MFRATKIPIYLKLIQRLGIPPARLMYGTGLTPATAGPGALISLDQYYTIVSNMIALTGNSGIAFDLSEDFKLSDYGIIGYAMLSCGSLRQALRIWASYSNGLIGTSIPVQSTEQRSGWKTTWSLPSKVTTTDRFQLEEQIVLGTVLGRELTGVSPVFSRATFSYPAPRHSSLYETFFNCPIEFSAKQSELVVKTPSLSSSINTQNDELFQICTRHCKQILQSLPKSSLLQSRLRQLFLSAPDSFPDMVSTAKALGISPRTLQRQLELEGICFQDIKDQFRLDLARQYLKSEHLAIKEVAHLLGYATPTAFGRAFKSWTGHTVGEFKSNAARADFPDRIV